MAYEIVFVRSARRELQRLPSHVAARTLTRIENLADEPRPPGSRKLIGSNDLWRIRVGEYRVVYSISDADRLIEIFVVRHRSEAYR